MSSEKLYPIVCLWCREKGIHKIVGYSEIEHSDGMCEKCKKEQLKLWKNKRRK